MFHIPYRNYFFSLKQTNFLTTLETQDSGGYILKESDASILFTAAKLSPLPQPSQFLFNKDEILLFDEYETLIVEKDRLSDLPESLIVHILVLGRALQYTRCDLYKGFVTVMGQTVDLCSLSPFSVREEVLHA